MTPKILKTIQTTCPVKIDLKHYMITLLKELKSGVVVTGLNKVKNHLSFF